MASDEEVVSMRLPKDLLRRAVRLVPRLKADHAFNPFGLRTSRSAVFRAALLRGLASLEERYAHAPNPGQGGRPARYHTSLPAAFPDATASSSASVTNVSVGGASLRTDRRLPVGSEVSLGISFPDAEEPVHVKGRIRHVVGRTGQRAPGAEPGLGIQFVNGDKDFRNRLHRFIDSITPAHGVPG